jgi:hypothetical protein
MVLSFFPLPIRDNDIDEVAARTVSSLLSGEPVLLDGGYARFHDLQHFDPSTVRLHYRNDAGIEGAVFDGFEIKPIGDDWWRVADEDWYRTNAVVEFTYRDPSTQERTRRLHFNFYHGWLGAQMYRLIVVRNFWGVFIFYRCVGVS